MNNAKITLKPDRQKSILRKHPWVFSGAIDSVSGDPQPGETIAIHAHNGDFLAWAAYSPQSQIRARIWTTDQNTAINQDFFLSRFQAALCLRKACIDFSTTNAYRFLFAESDGVPGLIIDVFDKTLSIQVLSTGVEFTRHLWLPVLVDLLKPDSVFERSDVSVRLLEGLQEKTGLLYGNPLPDEIIIQENSLNYAVDIAKGQKTGFYLDQRDNRAFLSHIAAGKNILNCFCYTGGFSIAALAGNANFVRSIDSSVEAIETAKKNTQLNSINQNKCEWVVGDVFDDLRKLRDRAQKFDLIILDPPKFAPTQAQAAAAARAYKDINLLAFKLLNPHGQLMTFSCSGGVGTELFQKIVADAAVDAGVEAKIIGHFHQAADHPIALPFRESEYLKGFFCQVN